MIKKESIYVSLVYLLIVLLLFSQFINIPFNNGIQPSTLLHMALMTIIVILSVMSVIKERAVTIDTFTVLFIIYCAVYGISFFYSNEATYSKLITLRETVFFPFIAIFIYRYFSTENSIDKIINLLLKLGVFFGAFGLIQYFFRNQLPFELLNPKEYNELFVFYNSDVIRANGMLGNVIMYGSIMLLFYSIYLKKLLQEYKFKYLVACIITFGAIVVSFSRLAFLGAILITIASFMVSLFSKGNKKLVISLFVIIPVLLLSIPYFIDDIKSSFLFSEVLNSSNQSVKWSNDTHLYYILESLKTFKESPLFGFGISTQKPDSIFSMTHFYVTDGAFFAKLLELGVVGICAYSALFIYMFWVMYKALKIEKYRYFILGVMIFCVYNFGIACIINSAFFGRTMHILFWIVFGLVLAIYKIHKKELVYKNQTQ